jgi:prepilin-type processing-associated H-X9-DG protein
MKPPRAWYRISVARLMILVAVAGPLSAGLARAVGRAGESARRARCAGNLGQIGMALLNYHAAFGCFPPAYVADTRGRPMHSWRVLILPFLHQQQLHGLYNFNEPWDGPNNRRLIGMMPRSFACPSHRDEGTTCTSYVVVTGPGTAFPGAGTAAIGDITDGLANSILVVESSSLDIPWTAPRDLEMSRMSFRINDRSAPGPSSWHPGGANVVFGDVSVRFLKSTLQPNVLKAMFTISGYELPSCTDSL